MANHANRLLTHLFTQAYSYNRQLLKDKRVLFAGYKMPHPLEYDVVLRIQTTSSTTPHDVLEQAIVALQSQITKLKDDFQVCVVYQFPVSTMSMLYCVLRCLTLALAWHIGKCQSVQGAYSNVSS